MKLEDLTIGELVTEDFRRADIFKKAGIDFCCGGSVTLKESCNTNDLDLNNLISQINELAFLQTNPGIDYKSWSPDFLADYIIHRHHAYVKNALPDLVMYTNKIAEVHGDNHAELKTIAKLFNEVNTELTQHMKAEEEVLFPAIKQALSGEDPGIQSLIQSEIDRMHGEHEFAGSSMDQIRKISQNYLIPDDACKTYQVCFQMLKDFEDDLHIHVHLENNILFKKAIEL